MRFEDIDKLTDEELKERLLTMSPEAAAAYRKLNHSSDGLLFSNLQEMEREDDGNVEN
jgi:hypothetical protein